MPTDFITRLAGNQGLQNTAAASLTTATTAAEDALAQQRKARKALEDAAVPPADSEAAKIASENRMREFLQGAGFQFGQPLGAAPIGYTKLTGQ